MAASSANMSKDSDSVGAIGESLVEALGNQRLHSVSLHDPAAEILWLSEGVMGPDEHNVVLEASNALGLVGDRTHIFQHLGDGRSALFLPARAPNGELVGLATILSESKWLDVIGANKLVNPQSTAAMRRLAILRKPAAAVPPPAARAPVAAVKPAAKPAGAPNPDLLELLLEVDSPPAAKPKEAEAARPPAPPAKPPAPVPRAVAPTATKGSASVTKPAPQKLTPVKMPAPQQAAPSAGSSANKPAPQRAAETPRKAAVVRATTPAKTIDFDGAEFELHVQQLLKLRSGGGTRRYEVLARRIDANDQTAPTSISDTLRKRIGTSQFDRLVVESLAKWLSSNPSVWEAKPASFSINLSLNSISDPKFLAFVATQIKSHGIPANTIGFELDESDCVQHRKDVDLFIAGCEKIGCFVAIDDFTLHSSAVQWLASRAVRFVKIDPRITQSAMTEKLSQAMVVAMSQASKVLGISCVAKRIDTPAARQWLSAVGVDYAQGFLLEQPRTLDSLLKDDGTAEA